MEFPSSPSSSSLDPGSSNPNGAGTNDPIQNWWESVSKARSRVLDLCSILPSSSSLPAIADSDQPARSLLTSAEAYSAVSSAISAPTSGLGSDPLCQWLYDTFQSSDPDLALVVLSFIPLVSGFYLSRIISSDPSPSMAGFEAVLLSIYASETKSRGGMPIRITIPDISSPSLYYKPAQSPNSPESKPSTRVLSPPLEPQIAMKSTKRASVVGVTLDCFHNQITQMPIWSKIHLCRFAAAWAGQNCSCRNEFDEVDEIRVSKMRVSEDIENCTEEMGRLGIGDELGRLEGRDLRIPLPWEILGPILRILGHCLLAPLNSGEVKDAASVAIRCLYARASHDLMPQAILATRSLIQLDKRSRIAAITLAASSSNTPTKSKEQPENLLCYK